MKGKFLTQHDPTEIANGLSLHEPIIYSENGNRSRKVGPFLRRIEKLAPSFGVTRVANISHFSHIDFPVFQSTRADIFGHTSMGQNSGSQGKGLTLSQAKISCLMETLEAFCMEPHSTFLIRNSYEFLKKTHFAVDPRKFKNLALKEKPDPKSPMLWVEAYGVAEQQTVLIPAELVFFPLVTERYQTRHTFIQGSNGISAGATYLEACLHALYEVIERHYTRFLYLKKTKNENIATDNSSNPLLQRIQSINDGENSLEIYSAAFPKLKGNNLPFIMASLSIDGLSTLGFGCSATVDISISRAASEALQAYTTFISGSREDINPADFATDSKPDSQKENGDDDEEDFFVVPPSPTLTVNQLKKQVINKKFKTLKDEYGFVVDWLKRQGYGRIYFANVTREGINIPVVRALIPGMFDCKAKFDRINWTNSYPENLKFRIEDKK